MIPRLDVRTCFAGYKLTKRQSVLVFLSSVILVVFLLMLTRSSADKNIFSPANICDGKGGCEKDRTTDERSGVQRRLQTLPCKSKSRMDHRELRKNVVGFQYQLPGETVDKDEDFLERDLHLCNLTAFFHREGASKQHKEVYTWLRALDDFIPTNRYLEKYDNPCWYSTLQPSPDIQSKMDSTHAITSPFLPLKQAVSAVKRVFSEASEKKEVFTCLPAVFLAGFGKSGTTSLFSYLVSHPSLKSPARKEPHFWRSFLTVPMNYTHKQMQVMWYLQRFSKAAQYIESHPNAVTIDASASTIIIPNPLYGESYYYDASKRRHQVHTTNPDSYENEQDLCFVPMVVHRVLPDAKFIVIMRNPVKRIFSDYWYFCAVKNRWKISKDNIPKKYMNNAPQIFHNVVATAIQEYRRCASDPTLGNKVLTEFTCLKKATLGYIEGNGCYPLRLGVGMYYHHIVKWLNVYPRKNFYFLRLEDMSTDTYNSVAKIWEFMGLTPISKATFESELKKEVFNEMNWIKEPGFKEHFYMLPETENMLNSFYEPFNKKLAQLLGNDAYLWSTY